MKKSSATVLLIIFSLSVFSVSCKKRNQKMETLKELYKTFSDGEIEECDYNGEIVFTCGLNAYDAGTTIYDLNGNIIGNCNYAWGGVDALCNQVSLCKTVYRVKDNIWGKPAVNKYHLK